MTELTSDDAVRLGIDDYRSGRYGSAIRNFSQGLQLHGPNSSYSADAITQMIQRTDAEFKTILNRFPQALATIPEDAHKRAVHDLVINN
jgi:hypothetical protein